MKKEQGISMNVIIIAAVALLILVVILAFGYIQLGWFSGPTTKYLISVTAEGGAVVGPVNEEGCFELTLEDADHIVLFSVHPEHRAMRTHPSALLHIWPEEFAENPPNADLELFDDVRQDEIMIVTLESAPIWHRDTQTLTFKEVCPIPLAADDSFEEDDLVIVTDPEDILSGRFSKAVLFIDDVFGHFVHDVGRAVEETTETVVEGTETAYEETIGQTAPGQVLEGTEQGETGEKTIIGITPAGEAETAEEDVETAEDAPAKVGEKIETVFKNLLEEVDYGHWEEYVAKQAGNIIRTSAMMAGEIGESVGGPQGKAIGERIGARLGVTAVSEVSKVVLMSDIGKAGFIETLDTSALYTDIEEALLLTADNSLLAYALASQIVGGQRQNIGDSIVTFLTDVGKENGKNSFCGKAIGAASADNLGYSTIHYLMIILESRIFNDLENEMSIDEIESDITDNLQDDLELAFLFSFYELKDGCITANEDDLYTFMYFQFFVLPAIVAEDVDLVEGLDVSSSMEIFQQEMLEQYLGDLEDSDLEEFSVLFTNYQGIEEVEFVSVEDLGDLAEELGILESTPSEMGFIDVEDVIAKVEAEYEALLHEHPNFRAIKIEAVVVQAVEEAGYEYDDYADKFDAAIDEVAETGDVELLRSALEKEEFSGDLGIPETTPAEMDFIDVEDVLAEVEAKSEELVDESPAVRAQEIKSVVEEALEEAGYEYDYYADELDAAIDEVAETGDVDALRSTLEEEEFSFVETEFIDPLSETEYDPLEWEELETEYIDPLDEPVEESLEESLAEAPAGAEIEPDIEIGEYEPLVDDPGFEVPEPMEIGIAVQQQLLTEEDFVFDEWQALIDDVPVEDVVIEDLPQIRFESLTSEQGIFSGVKSRFQSMSETSDAALWESAAAEFDLLASEGYDFYAETFAGEFSEAVTEEMVDSILEDVVEDAAESIAEETLEEGAAV